MSKLYDLLAAMIGKIKKPDWNQNNPTAPDYVKNRTHWDESKRTVFLEETVVDGFTEMNYGGCITENPVEYRLNAPLEFGKKYTVLWDGVEYQAELREFEGGCCFGHESYWAEWSDTDLPFGIEFWNNGGISFNGDEWAAIRITANSTEPTHTFAIYQDETKVHKIDPKFLPDNVGGGSGGGGIFFIDLTLFDGECVPADYSFAEVQEKISVGMMPVVRMNKSEEGVSCIHFLWAYLVSSTYVCFTDATVNNPIRVCIREERWELE